MPEGGNAREEILRAAEQLVAREGVKRLTIESVATEAGLSRGGVLYHFPSKEALIQGMVARLVDLFQQGLDAVVAADPEPRGRFTRAYARVTLLPSEEVALMAGGLLAGLAYDPRLLAPLHERLLEWQRRSEAELDPTDAAIVRLTAHALWTNGLLLPNQLDPELRKAIVERLEGLTR
ncbi:MAG: TetR/AcrR family transcriptional regulator [Roseiflexaceae bacterium]